jgi:tetratricopeptide (TPR) repeat protein
MVAFCTFAVWWSVRIAVADLAASDKTMEGFSRAMRIAPNDPELRMQEALFRSDNDDGENSLSVDEDLRLASRLNPYDSNLLMTLGVREEFRGDNTTAEAYLKRAVEVDRQFKPGWTLANFYSRTGQPEKSRPLIKHVLGLEPLGFDPDPVFALCWEEAGAGDEVETSRKILELIPAAGTRRVQYLSFLMKTKRADAALELWPQALQVFDAKDAGEVSVVMEFNDFLIRQNRIPDAVKVWNELAGRGVVQGEHLSLAKGVSVADPEFQFPLDGRGFHWRLNETPGVFPGKVASGLRLEISGNQPESLTALSVIAPVVAGKAYRLRWKIDGSALNSPRDPGFAFQVMDGASAETVAMQCGSMLAAGVATCDFVGPRDSGAVQIRLRYSRAPGTVRASGVLELSSVRLEPGT